MTLRTSTVIKFLIIISLTILLTLSLISASFYDPTLFHQLYPMGGIRNWCGIMGALTGGTLIELFGPASFLIPWFFLKLSYSSKRNLYRFSTGYYAMVLLFSISIAHALWWPINPSELSNSIFLLYPGYIGVLGVQWILQTINPTGANILIAVIIIFCTIKLFEELPFIIMISGIFNAGILFPIYLLQQIWQKLILSAFQTGYQWLAARFAFLKTSSPSQTTSLIDFLASDKLSSDPDSLEQSSDSDLDNLPPNQTITEEET